MKKLLFALLFVFGCNTEKITEPEFTLSGRYQSDDGSIIMLLENVGTVVESQIETQGVGGRLAGVYDKNVIGDGQVIMDGSVGTKKCHMNLFYNKALKTFSGSMIFYSDWESSGNFPVSFNYRNKLDKSIIHNQGGIQ